MNSHCPSDKNASRLEIKLDHIVEKINRIDSTLTAQHVTLVDHIRRTELLESAIIPVQAHVGFMRAGVKWGSGIIGVIGLTAAVFEILTYFKR